MSSGAEIAGSSKQLDYRSLVETTAARDSAMKTMKMVADTMEVCLLIVDDPQLLKYSASANRPVLAPLIKNRVATSYDRPADDSWQPFHEGLVNGLPQNFRDLFQAVMQLPKGQQNRNVVLLNGTLTNEAKLLSFLSKSALPVEPGSLADIRASENSALPYIALKGFIADSETLFNQTQLFLSAVGPNNPHFDTISGYVGAFSPLMDDLKYAFEQLGEPATEKYGRYLMSDVGNKLDSLANSFDRLYGGNELLLLGTSLHAAALQAKALSLEQPGAAPLLISLSLANQGIRSSESDLGILGNGLSAITDAFTSGAGLISKGTLSSSGSTALLSELATTAFTATLILGSLNYNSTATANQKQNEEIKDEVRAEEVKSENNFAYNLQLDILNHSRALAALSSTLVNAAEIKGAAKEGTQSLLNTTLLLLLLSPSISGTSLTSTEPLVKSQSSSIGSGIKEASSLLKSEDVPDFKVYLMQASIALEQGNSEAFLGALNSSIELSGTNTENLIADNKEINNVSQTLQNGVNTGTTNPTDFTTGVQVAA